MKNLRTPITRLKFEPSTTKIETAIFAASVSLLGIVHKALIIKVRENN